MEHREGTRRQVVNLQDRTELQTINIKRNPYLIEYEEQRKAQARTAEGGIRKTRERTAGGNDGKSVAGTAGRRIRKSAARTAGGSASKNGERIADASVRKGGVEERRRRARRRKQEKIRRRRRMLTGCVCVLILCVCLCQMLSAVREKNNNLLPAGYIGTNFGDLFQGKRIQGLRESDYLNHPTWTEDFLTPNEYSRPGDALTEVNSIFVHYTANQGTGASQNRSYFEQQKDMHERSVSAHFIIDYRGEIIQCVPLDEIAYAVQTRNFDSISIECCYLAADGSFTQETYDSLVSLLQWLVKVYDLDADEDVLRHYDCGGKKCPIYYVENEDAWKKLKEDVKN